jgi:hypothetical protein
MFQLFKPIYLSQRFTDARFEANPAKVFADSLLIANSVNQ